MFSVASQGKNLSLHVKLAMDKAALEQLDGAYPMKDNSMVILKAIMSYLEYIRSEVWKCDSFSANGYLKSITG